MVYKHLYNHYFKHHYLNDMLVLQVHMILIKF